MLTSSLNLNDLLQATEIGVATSRCDAEIWRRTLTAPLSAPVCVGDSAPVRTTGSGQRISNDVCCESLSWLTRSPSRLLRFYAIAVTTCACRLTDRADGQATALTKASREPCQLYRDWRCRHRRACENTHQCTTQARSRLPRV